MIKKGTIQLTQYFNHPPAKVWRALTDPEIHAKWWAAGDVRAELGHQFTLDMGPWGHQPCEVIAVEIERLLSYTFAPDTLGTTITFRLAPEGEGTMLHFEQSGFDLESSYGRSAIEGMGNGWPGILRRIGEVLEEG